MMGWMAPFRHLGAKVLVGREPPANSKPSMNEITTVGLDLAKQRAGHMTASDLYAARQIISCQAGAIHT
jgi:hypothetical protein